MEHHGAARRVAIVAALVAVGAGVALVVAWRASNQGPEPPDQNWWIVCWFVLAAAYTTAGAALLAWPARRRLAVCFVVIGLSALITAIAVQYRGFVTANGGLPPRPRLAELDQWSRPLTATVLAAFVPWELVPWRGGTTAGPAQRGRWRWSGFGVIVVVRLIGAPIGWERAGAWALCLAATVATAAVVVHWWRHDRTSDDPLPAWLLAGTVVAWLAVVPDLTDIAEWRLPGRDVVTAMLFIATVPLLVAGALIELMRRSPGGPERTAHRVVEWVMLTAGILIVYTALVAGLGQLVGGSGPTWFLVAATGVIALALEPGRQRVRRLVDRLVYGSRDDPLALVQRIVDHVGTGGGDDLLPSVVQSLERELRLEAVAIDLPTSDGWQRVASSGPPTPHRREVVLRHGDDVVGRLVVGWEHGPSLRPRDEHVLSQIIGPLTLAVRWVRLARRATALERRHRGRPRGGAAASAP